MSENWSFIPQPNGEYEIQYLRGMPNGVLANFIHTKCPPVEPASRARIEEGFEFGELMFFDMDSPVGQCITCDQKVTLSHQDWAWVKTWFEDEGWMNHD